MKLDQLSDASNLQLFRLLQGVDLPDYVKEAELDTHESTASLEKTAYADQLNYAFPINTPARVYISNAFFQSKKASIESKYGTRFVEELEGRIKNAAEAFSISNEIAGYNEAAEKRANRDYETSHVCAIEDADMPNGSVSLFPVKTAEDFTKSASVFAGNINKYPFDWREQIARAFVEKSADFGVDELPDLVCKYAGLFYPVHTSQMSSEVARRANKLSSKEARDRLTTLSAALGDTEFDSLADVMKVARIVHTIELQDGAYDRPKTAELLPDPVDVFFALPPTKVAEILNVVDMAGEKFAMTDLTKVSADQYKKAFGIDIDPSNESALRDVLPTMPLSDVALFKEITGIQSI